MTVIAHRCAVLGKPIAHSLSPVLHNAAYKALGLDDWAYERHEVGESDLDGFLKGLDPTWRGLSLTMPLKKTIQPYGTPSNMWAQRLKVANTAIFDWPAEPGITPGATPDGTSATGSLPAIRLYNTDVMGNVLAFDHELKALGEPDRWKSTSAAVIGNGNTAASAVAACTVMLKNGQTNKRITVAARHPGKNRQLPDIIGEGDAIAYEEKTIDASADTLRDGNDDSFRPRGILLDVVYDPRPSALIRAWRAKGGLAIGGEEMLLWQAILQVILMTGADTADSSLTDVLEPAMRHALEEAL